jgi:hypothetical protein
LSCAASASAQSNQSVYTDLKVKACRTLESRTSEAGWYLGRCPGVAGYKLLLQEGDLRQDLTVVTPGGKKHLLRLPELIGSSFSSLGEKAEWRMQRRGGKAAPVALIVRFNLSNPEDSSKITSYLAVAKITSGQICVTDKINPGANANQQARDAADRAAQKPCLKAEE